MDITVRARERSKKRFKELKKQREAIKEERKKFREEQKKPTEESEDESPKAEPITMQITETRTRSDKPETKVEPDKKASKLLSKTAKPKVDKKAGPPGPGQYPLPSDV